MSKPSSLSKNIASTLLYKIISFLLSFVSRYFLVTYIGIEILGISATVASIIQTLSLAELGFHAAVVFRLYKHLVEGNYDECNDFMTVLKRVYELIALFIFVLLLALCPFLKYFFKGIEINSTVYIIYFLSGANTIVSYLMAYKRELLYADKKDYVAKYADIIINLVMQILKIIALCITKNYYLFLLLAILENFLANFTISILCKKNYPWFKTTKLKKNVFKTVLGDVKNLAISNFAGYVYYSTDNLVISTFVNTVSVGFVNNYTLITSSLRLLAHTAVQQVCPFLGQSYVANKDKEYNFLLFSVDSFVRFVFAGMIICPVFLLITPFVSWWIGDEYTLSKSIVILLCLDIYIFLVNMAFEDYINITGAYHYGKYCAIIGAVSNIVASLILVKFLGIEGVLIGTIFSLITFWISRGFVFFKKIFDFGMSTILKYIVKNFYFMIVLLISLFISYFITSKFELKIFIFDFISKGFLIEVVFLSITLLCCIKLKEFAFIKNYFLSRGETNCKVS